MAKRYKFKTPPNWKPKKGQKVFYASPTAENGYVQVTWSIAPIFEAIYEYEFLFRTKKDVIMHIEREKKRIQKIREKCS